MTQRNSGAKGWWIIAVFIPPVWPILFLSILFSAFSRRSAAQRAVEENTEYMRAFLEANGQLPPPRISRLRSQRRELTQWERMGVLGLFENTTWRDECYFALRGAKWALLALSPILMLWLISLFA